MITIKNATSSDICIIEEIMLDVIAWLDSINKPQWGKENVTWSGLSKYYKIEDFYIAYIENKPVGCVVLVDYDPSFWSDVERGNSLFIHKLAVKRIGAGKGVSTALINFAKKKCNELNLFAVRLDCHRQRGKLRMMYEKADFVCVGEKRLFGEYDAALYLWQR